MIAFPSRQAASARTEGPPGFGRGEALNHHPISVKPLDPLKFRDPRITAKGETRAQVALTALETLWINTGTLCNITCANCYI
jgi:hypothetical protein